MKKIALTGNIGSGKSTIARIFETLGVPVYNADRAGHEILFDKNVIAEIEIIFGSKVISDGKVNRKTLAEIVFENDTALKKLNAIIHPRVMNDFSKYVTGIKEKSYVLFESALIYESDLAHFFDECILVYAPTEEKIKRVMKRDDCDRSSVISRLSHQMNDILKLNKADYIIINDDASLVIPQVLALHKKLSKL